MPDPLVDLIVARDELVALCQRRTYPGLTADLHLAAARFVAAVETIPATERPSAIGLPTARRAA